MRFAIAILLLITGCDSITPEPLPTTDDYLPAIMVAIAITVNDSPVTPTPVPSEVCDNCDGTGQVGDGTVFTICVVCDGTGKKTTAAANANTPSPLVEAAADLIQDSPEAQTPSHSSMKGGLSLPGDNETRSQVDTIGLRDSIPKLLEKLDANTPTPDVPAAEGELVPTDPCGEPLPLQPLPPVELPKLFFYTGENCFYCDKFKSQWPKSELSKQVELVTRDAEPGKMRPYFVFRGKRYKGYPGLEQFTSWIKPLMEDEK